jgi:hypothetical protein
VDQWCLAPSLMSFARQRLFDQRGYCHRVRMRVGVGGLAVLALVAVAGLMGGESSPVTIDHCYDHYTDRTRDTRCTGHWTRLGHRFTGPVYGVAVADDWQAILPAPRADGWDEVTVPDAARERPAVAVWGGALAVPRPVLWFVWAALVGVPAALLVLLARVVRSRRRPRRVAAPRP